MAGTDQLRRFQTTITKDHSSGDTRQIPASGATVTVYKHGASVKTAATVLTTNTTVAVYNVGRILAGDNVQLGTTAASQMTVVSVDSNTQLTLRSTIGSSIAVAIADRLIVYSATASLYADSMATTSALANPVTLPATGLLAFYTPETKFDYIVNNSGTLTSFIDNEGGWARGQASIVNVKDYSTFQAAINALNGTYGGEVFVPAQIYDAGTTPAVVPMTLTDHQSLIGQGGGSYLVYTVNNSDDILTINGDFSRVENLQLEGHGTSGSGEGIVINSCRDVKLKDVGVLNTPSYGLSVGESGLALDIMVDHCRFVSAKSGGAVRAKSFTHKLVMVDCLISPAAGRCLTIDNSQDINCYACTFEPQLYDPASTDGDTGAFVYCSQVVNHVTIDSCYFEDEGSNAVPNNWFVYLSGFCTGVNVSNCSFYRNTSATSSRILKSKNAAGNGVAGVVLDNAFVWVLQTPTGTDDIVLGAADFVEVRGGIIYNSASGAKIDLTTSCAAGATLRRYAGYIELTEQSDAAAPEANHARLYVKDNGAGKTLLVVRFPSGAVQTIATEP